MNSGCFPRKLFMRMLEHPMSEYWCYTLNHVNPETIFVSDNVKKYYWWCPKCGKVYLRTPKNMSFSTFCCKECSDKVGVVRRYKDMLNDHTKVSDVPELRDHWREDVNKIKADQVLIYSNKKYKWICDECGDEYERSLSNQNKTSFRCNSCSKKASMETRLRQDIKNHEVVADHPLLSLSWDKENNVEDPAFVTVKSNKKYFWICLKCGERYSRKAQHQKNGLCTSCARKEGIEMSINTRKSKTITISDVSLMLRGWDFEKNEENPSDIAAQSQEYFYFKCANCGKSYRRTAGNEFKSNHLCSECSQSLNMSYSELMIAYFLKKEISLEQHYSLSGTKMNFDIFIPSLFIAIEFDGVYYHRSETSKQRDRRKNRWCKQNGVRLIRIKEHTCNEVDGDLIYFKNRGRNYKWLMSVLCKKIGIELMEIDVKEAQSSVLPMMATRPSPNAISIRRPELLNYWDYDANISLNPNNLSVWSRVNVAWKCPICGHTWELAPNFMYERKFLCHKCALKDKHRGVKQSSR